MDSYRTKIKIRMGWWITWWVICVLAVILEALSIIDSLRHPGFLHQPETFMQYVWFVIFLTIAIKKIPSVSRLLQKDINKNPDNVFAKAMILERKVDQQSKQNERRQEKEELRTRIEEMEKQIAKEE